MKEGFIKNEKPRNSLLRGAKFALPEALLPLIRNVNLPQLTELLRGKMRFIAESVPGGVSLVSLGALDGEKELAILKELGKKGVAAYCAVNANSAELDSAMAKLESITVKKTAYVGVLGDLARLRRRLVSPLLFSCLGDIFCGYEPSAFLTVIRQNLMPQDLLLFDCHLFNPAELSQPYLDTGFPREGFEVRSDLSAASTPAGEAYRAKNILQIQKDFTLNSAAGILQLKKGQVIDLGFTYKYKFSQVIALLKRSRFRIVRLFISDDNENLVILARPLEEDFLQYSMMDR